MKWSSKHHFSHLIGQNLATHFHRFSRTKLCWACHEPNRSQGMVLLQKESIDTCELSADALAADFFFPDNPIIPETWMLEYSPAVGLLMVAVTFSFHPKIDSSAKHSFYCLVGMAVVYYQTSSMWWLGHCSWLLCLRPSLPTLSVKYTISPFFFWNLKGFIS